MNPERAQSVTGVTAGTAVAFHSLRLACAGGGGILRAGHAPPDSIFTADVGVMLSGGVIGGNNRHLTANMAAVGILALVDSGLYHWSGPTGARA